MYRPVGTSSSELFVFDAETCSPALDSYKELAISGLESGVIEDVMDLDPHTTGQLTDLEDTSTVWMVENLEGSKWNSFNLLGYNDVTLKFAAETHFSEEDEYVRILSMPEYMFKDRVTSQYGVNLFSVKGADADTVSITLPNSVSQDGHIRIIHQFP